MDDTARQISDAILRILVAEPTLSPEQRQALTTVALVCWLLAHGAVEGRRRGGHRRFVLRGATIGVSAHGSRPLAPGTTANILRQLEGTVIATRDSANADYYGRTVTAEDILSGKEKPPASADRLRKELAKI